MVICWHRGRATRPVFYILAFLLASATLHLAVDLMLQGQTDTGSDPGPEILDRKSRGLKKGFHFCSTHIFRIFLFFNFFQPRSFLLVTLGWLG